MSVTLFLKYLVENGPATSSEVADVLGISYRHAAAAAFNLLRNNPRTGQRVHIVGWIFDHPGQKRYPRAVFAAGPGKNVKKPPIDYDARYKREYKARKSRHLSSVFTLAIPIKRRHERHAD